MTFPGVFDYTHYEQSKSNKYILWMFNHMPKINFKIMLILEI